MNDQEKEAVRELLKAVVPVSYIHNDVITDARKRRDSAYGDDALMGMRQAYLDARLAERNTLEKAIQNVKGIV